MENYIETALVASEEELLTVIEFIEITRFPIDVFMIDRFWNTMEENRLIYVDDELIRWMGYKSASSHERKRDFLDMFHQYKKDHEFFNYATKEYSDFLSRENPHNKNLYPPAPTARGSVNTKHLLLTPDCLRPVMMRVNTSKGKEVRQYYISLEKLFKTYVKYQMEFKNIETERLLKATKKELADNKKELADNKKELVTKEKELADNKKELANNKKELVTKEKELADNKKELANKVIYINNVKSLIENVHYLVAKDYVYIATTFRYASRNQFKIGRAGNLQTRLSSYNSGRPEGDRYFYVNIWSTCNSVLLEKKITDPIDQWRDSHDREMFVINYDWLCSYLREVCEHDNVEMRMVNDLVKNYSEIVSRKPPKVVPLLKYPKKRTIVPIGPETKEELPFTYSIKGLSSERTKKFITTKLKEYKKENENTSWSKVQKFLTIELKEHDKKPNVKKAKNQILAICYNVGIEMSN